MDELKVSIFFSYSHRDEKLCRELQKHLIQLERAGLTDHWYDGKIMPGSQWNDEIKTNLQKADIILFLISADFLHSEYIYENEVKQALQQHHNGLSVVVPVMLRKCDIELTPFSSIRGLPTDMEPVCSKKWPTRDEAFFNITHGIKSIIYRERDKKKIFAKEEIAWANARNMGTVAAYADYIKNSPLKTHLEEALQQMGVDSAIDYKRKYELQNIELELEREKGEWVACELHDNIGQQLAVVRLYMGSERICEEKEWIKTAYEVLNNSIKELSALNRPWRDRWYHYEAEKWRDFDLRESITKLCQLISSIGNIIINTDFSNLEDIKDVYCKITVLRIIQKCLQNILKHARASKVDMLISIEEKRITMSITDNGIGIKQNNVLKKPGMGLANVKARVSDFQGTFSILQPENGGCEVKVTIPKR